MHSRLRKLQDRKAALTKTMEALLVSADKDSRTMTAEEDASYKAYEAELAEVNTGLEREEALRKHIRSMDPVVEPEEPKPDPKNNPKFGTLGEFAQAVARAAKPGGYVDPRLGYRAQTGMSEGVPADGGFLVETETAAGLFKRAYDGMKVWNRARNFTLGANSNRLLINCINETTRVGSRLGGILAYWLAEGGTKLASQPEFRQISLQLNKLIGLTWVTDELLQDATALESYLTEGFAEEFSFRLDDAAINGLGAGQPLGVMASPALVTVAAEVGQAPTTIVAENVENMYARMHSASLSNSVWFINQMCWPQLFRFFHATGAGAVPLFVPAGGLSVAPFGTLLGRPIIPIEQCAALGTTGDIIFADMSQYVTISKGGLQSASSIHLHFNLDETCFRWVLRVDGQPLWNSPLTPFLGGAGATQSPFIALAGRP